MVEWIGVLLFIRCIAVTRLYMYLGRLMVGTFYLACLLRVGYVSLLRLSSSPYDQLYQTSTSNYAVVSKYGEVLIRKINASIWFRHIHVKKKSLMEDNMRCRGCTLIRTPRGTFHWWVCCCDTKWWSYTGFYARDCGQWGSETKFYVLVIF